MFKRRKTDNCYNQFYGKSENYTDEEDYTADFETYDFSKNRDCEVDDFTQKIVYKDSFENGKIDYNLIQNDDECNSDNVCRDFLRNICRRGRKCKYKHTNKRLWSSNETGNAINPVQYEVNFCHDYQNNGCNRPQCRFVHCSRSEQEFYYATGILVSSVSCNNLPVSFCKDYINNSCTRIKCKYPHLTKEEVEQSVQHTGAHLEPNSNYYTNSVGVDPNNITNPAPHFAVSLPLGSVSYSTSQTQLIAQPSLTNVQYIHKPILSSVCVNQNQQTQIQSSHKQQPPQDSITVTGTGGPTTATAAPLQPTEVNAAAGVNTPGQQQVLYRNIIQHHNNGQTPAATQFAIISSDNHHTLSLPVADTSTSAIVANPATGHILHAPAPPPPQQPHYTINQQAPVGVSLISVATPCSILSASPATAEVVHTIQPQQLRPFDQKDATTVLQNKTHSHIELTPNDNSTFTPIYIHQSLPPLGTAAVPTTIPCYRVTTMETNSTVSTVNSMTNSKLSDHEKLDTYSKIIQENEQLKKKVLDLETANELLLDQNARLRNLKSALNVSESELLLPPLSSPSIISQSHHRASGIASSNNSSSLHKQPSTSSSELATITLTVPLATQNHNPGNVTTTIDRVALSTTTTLSTKSTLTNNSNIHIISSCNSSPNSSLISTDSSNNRRGNNSNNNSYTECISPNLVSSAIQKIEKSVMPTLHALVASNTVIGKIDKNKEDMDANAGSILEDNGNRSYRKNQKSEDQSLSSNSCRICVTQVNDNQKKEHLNVEIPIRSSSCPVVTTDQTDHHNWYFNEPNSASNNKVCRVRIDNLNQRNTPQLCFQ